MLMHFRFVFESMTALSCPGEYIRYCRRRQGLTTRQLADKLHIVPATVCGYEQGRFPLPYDIAVAISEILQIPSNVLFDEYCSFIGFPYNERLQKIRANYYLSQAEFANKANIAPSIYSKWESGYRRPSRKMYLALKAAYPKIWKWECSFGEKWALSFSYSHIRFSKIFPIQWLQKSRRRTRAWSKS